MTNYADLAAAIRASIAQTLADPFVFGPTPLEIACDRIVVGTILIFIPVF
jgi:hypothetical protein